jgi:pimeloyl-ACP methyl ester carboxylesterase
MKKALAAVAVLVGIACAWIAVAYLANNPEHRDLDDAARRAAPGRFVRLRDGVTHYQIDGPDSGRTVVLVHGFSVPYYIWDSTAAALAGAGYRVVRYDEYGRGLSDRPREAYTADLFDRQLVQLLDSLGIHSPVDVAGVSQGGAVVATFASRHPLRTRSVMLVDPVAGARGGVPFPFNVPALGPVLWQAYIVPGMADGQMSDFAHPGRFPDWVSRYRDQMQYRGFGRALLSSRKAGSGLRLDSLYRAVSATGLPVLLLWGKEDKTVPFANNESVRAAIPSAEFHAVDDAGHLPILEQAALADSLILQFLARHSGR